MDIDKENISSIKIHKYTLDYLKHIFLNSKFPIYKIRY